MSLPLTITLGSGAGSVSLANSATSTDIVEGITLDGQPIAQLAELARALSAVPINRGDWRHKLAFTVKQASAASPIKGLKAALNQLLAVEACTQTSVILVYGTTGDTFTLTVSNCIVRAGVRHQGKMPIIRYDIDGGAYTVV